MKNQILVLGGTGKTGKRIVNQLKQLEHPVRIGSRSASIPFDWHKPNNWSEVFEDIHAIYITYQPDLAVPGALEAIEELVKQAKRAGVVKLVLLSGKGEQEAQLCEQVVIHSGLAHTIIRANWFSQNWSESFLLEPILAGQVALPMADVQIPFVDANDIAAVAVKALTEDKHNGAIYQLTGSKTYSFKEAVQLIAKTVRRDIKFTPVSIEAYTQVMRNMQLPEDYVWLISYLFTEVLGNPDNSIITNDIRKILNREPISFSTYVKEVASTGLWSEPSLV